MGSETAVLKDLVASEGPIELEKCRDPPNQCGAGNGCPPKGASREQALLLKERGLSGHLPTNSFGHALFSKLPVSFHLARYVQ